jgi:hypothetical protein
MGSKQKINQAPTLTPDQQALLSAKIKANRLMAMNLILGQGWGGPNSGQMVNAGTGQAVQPAAPAAQGANPLAKAIASATPGQVENDPFGMAAYSNRNALVNPIVNPFRRNLGG